jgi:hypothetical protein
MARWTDEELQALEDPERWEPGELMEPVPREQRGARVTIRLGPGELERLDVAAEQAGLKLTEFIRQAALERAALPPVGRWPKNA